MGIIISTKYLWYRYLKLWSGQLDSRPWYLMIATENKIAPSRRMGTTRRNSSSGWLDHRRQSKTTIILFQFEECKLLSRVIYDQLYHILTSTLRSKLVLKYKEQLNLYMELNLPSWDGCRQKPKHHTSKPGK